jgi:hypothetical protein
MERFYVRFSTSSQVRPWRGAHALALAGKTDPKRIEADIFIAEFRLPSPSELRSAVVPLGRSGTGNSSPNHDGRKVRDYPVFLRT